MTAQGGEATSPGGRWHGVNPGGESGLTSAELAEAEAHIKELQRLAVRQLAGPGGAPTHAAALSLLRSATAGAQDLQVWYPSAAPADVLALDD